MQHENTHNAVANVLKFKVLPIYSIKAGICTCKAGKSCSSPGKHPMVGDWCNKASDSREQYLQWNKKWPECNWGIAAGHDGLAIVDIDPKNGGHLSWVDLITKHGGYPATLMVQTGSGGTHLYYKVPAGKVMLHNSTSRVGVGIDIRGYHGYCVAPPSNHQSGGRYSWCEPKLDIAEMPLWLYDLAKEPPVYNQSRKDDLDRIESMVNVLLDGVGEGRRNKEAARVAGIAIAYYKEDPWSYLYEWNQRNNPPLPEAELDQVFKSIQRREGR